MHHGALVWITAASTTLGAATPAKASGTTNGTNCDGFSHSDNRLTYTGQVGRTFNVVIMASITKGAGGSSETASALYLNGSPTGAEIGRTIASASDEGALAVGCLIKMKKDDYVELWLETDTGDDLTISVGSTMVATVAG